MKVKNAKLHNIETELIALASSTLPSQLAVIAGQIDETGAKATKQR